VPFHVIDIRSLELFDVGLMGVVHVIPSVEVIRIPVDPLGNAHCPTATHRYPFHATDFACPVSPASPDTSLPGDHVSPSLEYSENAAGEADGFSHSPVTTKMVPFHATDLLIDPSVTMNDNLGS
jgi:hypothetical protein